MVTSVDVTDQRRARARRNATSDETQRDGGEKKRGNSAVNPRRRQPSVQAGTAHWRRTMYIARLRLRATGSRASFGRRRSMRRPLTTSRRVSCLTSSRRSGIFTRSLQAPAAGYIVGCTWSISTARCDAVASVSVVPTTPSVLSTEHTSWSWKELKRKARRAFRVLVRLVKLAVTLAPVVAFYPILLLTHKRDTSQDAHNIVLATDAEEKVSGLLGWYLHMCLHCVESSGAAVIKFMQWAGSRPDLFGHDFCNIFSALQDNTTPHSWNHTRAVMEKTFGPDWERKVQLFEIVGSGCIGQVYRGQVERENGSHEEVAVKVLHPNVEADIDADLDLMRLLVRGMRALPFDVFANVKWLNLEAVVEEFARLLKMQLDLRQEAANLERFGENFAGDPNIVFPALVPGYTPSRHVLVETFCPGLPILQFAREHRDDRTLLHDMCKTAIRAVCKMIFLDNYMHGDLHPGNVFISPDGKKFIILDVGIVTEYTDVDHNMLVDVLAAFCRKDGRQAGRLLIDDSNNRLMSTNPELVALDEERYIDKIEALTIKASDKNYFMEHLGTYISYICDAAATHHVMMNQAFVTAALAVKVEEGIALALDPSVRIATIATPVIVESETRRKWNDSVKSWSQAVDGIFGSKKQGTQ